MDVYLVQHGAATSEAEDPQRPLTAAGRAAVEDVAARLAAGGERAGVCVHSGKLRAEQTAIILGAALGAEVVARAGLDPSDRVTATANWLKGEGQRNPAGAIALVGHLPLLERLASLLIAGDEGAQVVRFHNAGVVKLVPKPAGAGFSVDSILLPGAR